MMRMLEGRAEAVAGTINVENVANTLWAYAKMGREPGAGMMRVLEGRAEAVAGTMDAGCGGMQKLPHGPWCVYRASDNDTIRKIALKCGAEEKVLLAINRQIKGLRVLSLLFEGTVVNIPPPHGLREELAMAFAMGTHERLGAGSAAAGEGGGRRRSRRAQEKAPAARREEEGCPYLMMPADLVKRVVEACGGVVRLMDHHSHYSTRPAGMSYMSGPAC